MSGTVLKVLTGRNSIKPNGKQGMFYKQPKIIKEIDFANALTIILATLLRNTYKKILLKKQSLVTRQHEKNKVLILSKRMSNSHEL